ncbi:MAG TPA: SPFH domain-containing protein [Caldisericia bacterium]|nr:SPFH domain-containing protein [Caldisericia bacterium]HPF48977.1 SPFH domain-containing protein [Caldisericia bacterium]HPI83159.1 SPFH domain-containing protein [Caldisericia bacterium]HPQ92386.1 SPFH domain-containing protein [Caldisericia bacterium]HRV74516.1 SPFH domain-containing protein [Caldisericia bacterium]
MNYVHWIVIASVAFVILVITQIVKLVQQSKVILIERLGRYSRTLQPGLHILVPFIDRIRSIVDLREQVMDFPPQSVITRDNVPTEVDTVIYFYITDPVKSIYEIKNLKEAILKLAMTTIRNIIGNIELDELLSSREQVNQRLRIVIDEATDPWGVKVNRIELKTIDPPAEILEAMTKQMKAERNKRANVLEAEGVKQANILKAEGDRKSNILKAEGEAIAWETVWEAKAKAVERYFNAIHAGNPDKDIIAIKYLETFGKLAEGDNSKIFIPYEASGIMSSIGAIKDIWKETK